MTPGPVERRVRLSSPLHCRIDPYWIKAAPQATPLARPPPGSALGAPARHGHADAGQQPKTGSFRHGQVARCHLPRLQLSNSQAPRLGRPPGVASRWLRQPRPGAHSQGFGACEEDGRRAVRLCQPLALAAGTAGR
jgi:hypothetical protein